MASRYDGAPTHPVRDRDRDRAGAAVGKAGVGVRAGPGSGPGVAGPETDSGGRVDSGPGYAEVSVRAMEDTAFGPTRQQPPISRAPDSRHPRTCSAVKVERPFQARASASQASPLFG